MKMTDEERAEKMPLIPPFEEGEQITIQRSVNGKNVLMHVKTRNPGTLTEDRMVLTAEMLVWGESSYADGRVARQLESINRLLARLQYAEELIQGLLLQAPAGPNEIRDRAADWLDEQSGGPGQDALTVLKNLNTVIRDRILDASRGQPWIPGGQFKDGAIVNALNDAESVLMRIGVDSL